MDAKMMILVGLILASVLALGCDIRYKCGDMAKICSDGTVVGAEGPNCEFAACPEEKGSQIANPASVYCTEQGGTLKMVETPEGTQGICVLADGTECDEWAYFRAECPVGASHICTAEEKAATMCTMEYMPVCGNDGITYGNKCSACASGIDSWINGECPVHICSAEEKANQACTREYMPVCGSDGNTYGNDCTACAAKVDSWVQGECPQ